MAEGDDSIRETSDGVVCLKFASSVVAKRYRDFPNCLRAFARSIGRSGEQYGFF